MQTAVVSSKTPPEPGAPEPARPDSWLARFMRYRLSMKAFPPNRRGWTPKLRESLFAPLLEEVLLWANKNQSGKIGWILLWLLGVPIPILLVLFFLRGCT